MFVGAVSGLRKNWAEGIDSHTTPPLSLHCFYYLHLPFSSVQFSSVAQSCPTLCGPMNRSTPGLPVHQHLLEFTQTHIHRVSDAIQPSHPQSPLLLLPPRPPSIRVFSNESTLHMRWPSIGFSALASFLPKKFQG